MGGFHDIDIRTQGELWNDATIEFHIPDMNGTFMREFMEKLVRYEKNILKSVDYVFRYTRGNEGWAGVRLKNEMMRFLHVHSERGK